MSELSNYIDKSQLPSSLGGYLIYCHQSWVSFVKVNLLTFGQCWCEALLHWLDHEWSTLSSFWKPACFFTSICLSVKHSAKRQRLSVLWSVCKLNIKAHCAALLCSTKSFAILYKSTLGPSYIWRDTLLLLWRKIRQPNGFLRPDRSFCGKVLSFTQSGDVFIWNDSWEPFEQPASIVCYLGEAQANNQLTLLATERSPFSPSHYICSHVHRQSVDVTTLINRSSSVPIADTFNTHMLSIPLMLKVLMPWEFFWAHLVGIFVYSYSWAGKWFCIRNVFFISQSEISVHVFYYSYMNLNKTTIFM